MSKALLITGTDTETGKTRVAISILMTTGRSGMKVAGMKPVASGCEIKDGKLKNEDAIQLIQHSNIELDYDKVNPFSYEPPIAPHVAAARAKRNIDLATIEAAYNTIKEKADLVVVEGIGGWRVPLTTDGKDISALANKLELPVILVVGMKLGCINHAMLSAEAIRKDNCNLAGWIANSIDPDYDTTEETIETLTTAMNTEPIAVIPHSVQPQPLDISAAELISRLSPG